MVWRVKSRKERNMTRKVKYLCAIGLKSGHTIGFKNRKALKQYLTCVDEGEAEPIIMDSLEWNSDPDLLDLMNRNGTFYEDE
jgi:hypothetical protein